MSAINRVAVCRLRGLVGYNDASRLQRTLLERRKAGLAPDTLLLLEHSLGLRSASAEEAVVADQMLEVEIGESLRSD